VAGREKRSDAQAARRKTKVTWLSGEKENSAHMTKWWERKQIWQQKKLN
jgi:hypothetical protein